MRTSDTFLFSLLSMDCILGLLRTNDALLFIPSKKFGRFVSTGNDSERRHVIKSTPDDWDRRSG